MTKYFFVLLMFCMSSYCYGQPATVKLSGSVVAADTHETIPGASLILIGTGRGARTNRLGEYSLELETGKPYRIKITSLGYKTDTLSITLRSNTTRNFSLSVSPLQANEITVSADASRKEARRIMHQAISTKVLWHNAVDNYTCDVYSRINVQKIESKDTTLLTIFETYSNGFFDKIKGHASHIIARKQTANVPADLNKLSLLGISSLYDDRIDLGEYAVVSPLAEDAFDRYDYDLLGTRQIAGATAYEISVEPRGVIVPAFDGKVWIDVSDYSLVYAQIRPNGALKFPLVTSAAVEQSYIQVDHRFGFPSQTHMTITAAFQIPFTPTFSAELTGLMQNYAVNTKIDDSVFAIQRIIVDSSADKTDSNIWSAMRGVSLTSQEQSAYAHIDSVVKTEGPPPEESALSLSPFPDISYDRVQALRLGASLGIHLKETIPFDADLLGGYAFCDKKFRYTTRLSMPLLWHYSERNTTSASINSSGDISLSTQKTIIKDLTAHIGFYNDIAHRGNVYDRLVSSAIAAVFKSDYPDYYGIKGGDIGVVFPVSQLFSLDLSYTNRDEFSLIKETDKSLLFQSDSFRTNPAINDGTFRALSLSGGSSFDIGSLSISPGFSVVYSSPNISSSFDYAALSLESEFSLRIPGLGPTSLQLVYHTKLSGEIPNQHLFSFESRDLFIAERFVFHTTVEHEYQGDESYSAMLEQNFYDLPTRLLGLDLRPIDLHWIGFINAGMANLTHITESSLRTAVKTTGDVPFVEAGFGIGNILNLLRVDAAWRVTHRLSGSNFAVTATLGISF